MKLTAKFLLAFVLTTLVILAMNAVLRVQREISHFDDDMRRDVGAFAFSLARSVAVVATGVSPEQAALIVQNAAERAPHLSVRWVSLDRSGSQLGSPTAAMDELEPLDRGELVFAMIPAARRNPGALLAYARVDGDVPGIGETAIEVEESLEVRDRFVLGSVERTAIIVLVTFVASALVAVVLGFLLIGRPLAAIVRKVHRIASGDLTTPLVVRQRDEIGEVATALNAMCDRLAQSRADLETETSARITALDQLRHADRLATVGRLAAGIAHEIGTPLAVAGGRSQMIVTGEVVGEEAVENAQIVVEQTRRIAHIIRQLLDFARRSPAQRSRVDLVGLARRTVALLEPLAKKRRVSLVLVEAGHASADADVDAGQIEQALTNLLMNAIHATAAGGQVIVTLDRSRTRAPSDCGGATGDFISMEVADTGSGMDAETLAHVFDPFFTTKEVGEGTGLGLPVAHGLVREHGGWIEVQSELGTGSRFTAYLPVTEDLTR